MNYAHLVYAFLGATVAYFAAGFAAFAVLPGMKSEFAKYPNVYRPNDAMTKLMPYNVVGILISIAIIAVLYARMYPAGGGIVSGMVFGALLGVFAVCTYAVHNYVLLNISATLVLYEGVTYFIQWVIVGAAIGLIYKPA